mmetsp:Transcript_102206/g.284682  ORF Transcript_102206/g.284682 Transcript_102206/m.284682 type:complete len:232 (-) Transcript_102206:435-1130(-)
MHVRYLAYVHQALHSTVRGRLVNDDESAVVRNVAHDAREPLSLLQTVQLELLKPAVQPRSEAQLALRHAKPEIRIEPADHPHRHLLLDGHALVRVGNDCFGVGELGDVHVAVLLRSHVDVRARKLHARDDAPELLAQFEFLDREPLRGGGARWRPEELVRQTGGALLALLRALGLLRRYCLGRAAVFSTRLALRRAFGPRRRCCLGRAFALASQEGALQAPDELVLLAGGR